MPDGDPVIVAQFPTDTQARWKVVLVVTKSAGSAIISTLMGVNWVEMTGQQQIMAVIAIMVNVVTAIEALYDKTMSTRAAGKAAAGRTSVPFPARGPVPGP